MSDEKRYRDVADMGWDDGFGTAMDEVNKLMHELYAANQPDLVNTTHVVWQRLMERQDPAMAERKAKRAARDQYAAEIAAREKQS